MNRGNEQAQVNDTLLYRDYCISVFNDDEKCLLIFVNDRGNTKVLNYDDNFYCIEDNIITYYELLKNTLDNEDEHKEYLEPFIAYIKKEIEGYNQELNIDYLEHYGFDRGLFE